MIGCRIHKAMVLCMPLQEFSGRNRICSFLEFSTYATGFGCEQHLLVNMVLQINGLCWDCVSFFFLE